MKGSVTASCGHKLADDEEGVDVMYGTDSCDAIEGFRPAVAYAHFCQKCAAEWKVKGWLFADQAEADAYLGRPT